MSASLFPELLFVSMLGPALAFPASSPEEPRLLTDFTATGADPGQYVMNDNVMSGRSEGGFDLRQQELIGTDRTSNRDSAGPI